MSRSQGRGDRCQHPEPALPPLPRFTTSPSSSPSSPPSSIFRSTLLTILTTITSHLILLSEPILAQSFAPSGYLASATTWRTPELRFIDAANVASIEAGSDGIIRVDVGSLVATTDGSQKTWAASVGICDGSYYTHQNKIPLVNFELASMLQTESYGIQQCRLRVPNGVHLVKLYFVEYFEGLSAPDERVFDVNVEGQTIINLDVFLEAQRDRPLIKTFIADVRDGELNINFNAKVQAPMLSGLEIVAFGGEASPARPSPTPTSTPTPEPTPTLAPTLAPTAKPTSGIPGCKPQSSSPNDDTIDFGDDFLNPDELSEILGGLDPETLGLNSAEDFTRIFKVLNRQVRKGNSGLVRASNLLNLVARNNPELCLPTTAQPSQGQKPEALKPNEVKKQFRRWSRVAILAINGKDFYQGASKSAYRIAKRLAKRFSSDASVALRKFNLRPLMLQSITTSSSSMGSNGADDVSISRVGAAN